MLQIQRPRPARRQRELCLRGCERGYIHRDLDRAQIAVVEQGVGRAAHDTRVRHIHSVADEGGRRVGLGGGGGQHGHAVGNAQ